MLRIIHLFYLPSKNSPIATTCFSCFTTCFDQHFLKLVRKLTVRVEMGNWL